jgi:hypothetical protein
MQSVDKSRFRSKIVENLAVVNYDTNNLDLAPYDWRLSYSNLEERDGYFSRLKTTIEGLRYAPIILVSSCVINLSLKKKAPEEKGCPRRTLDGRYCISFCSIFFPELIHPQVLLVCLQNSSLCGTRLTWRARFVEVFVRPIR